MKCIYCQKDYEKTYRNGSILYEHLIGIRDCEASSSYVRIENEKVVMAYVFFKDHKEVFINKTQNKTKLSNYQSSKNYIEIDFISLNYSENLITEISNIADRLYKLSSFQ